MNALKLLDHYYDFYGPSYACLKKCLLHVAIQPEIARLPRSLPVLNEFLYKNLSTMFVTFAEYKIKS